MGASLETSYDRLPYEAHSHPQTHPDRLATVATLLGMRPPPVPGCRVLELGCASGGNLIPMAVALPESTFVGIDLSARQIAQGRQVIDALGLRNVRLEAGSILEVDAGWGSFDYIICHGVYSWVPAPVRDHILAVCAHRLAANGVAFISYNTYPGWHLRGVVRDLLIHHTRSCLEPEERVRRARDLLALLHTAIQTQRGAYAQLLEAELELLRCCGDSYLFHEHLEEVNEPTYFHEFMERATARGLQFLAEAELGSMVLSGFPPEIESTLRAMSADIIQLEQYFDFLRNRTFRQTLLCKQGTSVNYCLDVERLRGLYAASPARPLAAEPDIHSTAEEHFTSPRGAVVKSVDPLAKAALVHLADVWPRALRFDDLCAAARTRLNAGGGGAATEVEAREDILVLGQCLLTCYLTGPDDLVYLGTYPPRFAADVCERPLATPLARFQAAASNRATNLRHQPVSLDDLSRAVLLRLDGCHDRADLLHDLEEAQQQGQLDGNGRTDPLDQVLLHLASSAFLLR
jgi:methyltransferase-like protein/2-polyprenyl-3-methyl-5-hydroxy-6-metoxy-1,4-benzoquinol methylase